MRPTAGVEVAAALSQPLADAAEALRKNAEFRFADAGGQVEVVERPAEDSGDDEFNFFSD